VYVHRNDELYIRKSTDGGSSFGSPVFIRDFSSIPGRVANTAVRVFSILSAAVDPNDGTIYVVWSSYGSDGYTSILLVSSADGGQTWSNPKIVNDDNGKSDHFMPAVTVGRDGVVHFAWLDRRDDPSNTAYNIYYTRSFDHGRTFEPNVRVSAQSSNSNELPDPTFIGDYIGISVDAANRVHVAWNGVGPSRIAATFTVTIYQSQTTASQTSTLSTSEASTGTTPSQRVTSVASSSTLMTPLQPQAIVGSNMTYATVAIGVLTLVAISVIATKRKRTKHG
jgi:hypothetical protein